MDVFTDAQTPTRVSRAFATLPPAPVPDESSGATATTPPSSPAYNINSYSPSQYCKPATPTNSTPLHRRFLRSISMSPAIPSPSTPTPNSPAKTRPTPAHRKSESPIKLEVGPGVFYFSIALPASKITPKKGGTPGSKATTPGRDAGTQGTPTKTPTVKELAARYHGTAGDFGTPTRSSPLKHASPVKEIPATPGTPTKRTRSLAKHSPLRPPFGTPKSIRTPRSETGSDTGTLTQRTPTTRSTSPLKDHSPGKRSPARALFGTLTKKGTVRTPNGSRPGSPVKRTIERLPTEPEKKVSKRAKELLSTPTERLRIPPECLVDVTEDEALSQKTATDPSATAETAQSGPSIKTGRLSTKPHPENIGQLMASLRNSNASRNHDRGVADDAGRPTVSPVPTPLRRASQKLRLAESPSFLRLSTNKTSGEADGDVKARGSSVPHREANGSQRKDNKQIDNVPFEAAGGTACTGISATQTAELNYTKNASLEDQPTSPLRRVNPDLSTAFDMVGYEQTPRYQYSPLLFPKPEPEVKLDEPSAQSEEQVQRREMDDTPGTKMDSQHAPTIQHRRIGTDPSVILKMQQEMANLEATMRRSAGVVDPNFCGPLNLNELPAMSSSFFSSRRDPTDVRSPGAIGSPRTLSRVGSPRRLSRANSNASSIAASMGMSAQSRPQLMSRVSSTPKLPRWKPSGPTPAQQKQDKLMAIKQMRTEKITGFRLPRSRAESSASNKSTKSTRSTAAPILTPRKAIMSPSAKVTSPGSRIPLSPTGRIPAVTPVNSAAASPFSATHRSTNPAQTAAALRKRLSSLKTARSTPQLRGPARPLTVPEQYNPLVDHRPYEQKFASAIDIANRLKEWHDEDRKRAEAETPRSKIPVKTPPKNVAKTPTKTVTKESTTPSGSPTKLLTPIKESATPSPPKPRPLSINPNPPSTPKAPLAPISKVITTSTPKTPAAKTPAARNPTLHRVKAAVPKTPANRRTSTLDRYATRTPSKAIVSSLDKAIDEKIREDARSGREFTPGGNRVKDLLDARGVAR